SIHYPLPAPHDRRDTYFLLAPDTLPICLKRSEWPKISLILDPSFNPSPAFLIVSPGFFRASVSARMCKTLLDEGEGNAGEILGSAWFNTNSSAGKSALWRKHLLRGNPPQRTHLHIRLRHRLPQFRQTIGSRSQRDSAYGTHLSLSFSLGPHP